MMNRATAVQWARDVLQNGCVIIDTETTGLGNTAEVCQIAIIDQVGHTLMNSLVRPTLPIPAEATAIHGITEDMVRVAPTFDLLWPAIRHLLQRNTVVVYNASYDTRVIAQSLHLASGDFIDIPKSITYWRAECAMLQYAAYVGEPSTRGSGYKWQKLPSVDHSALGDCQATLALLQRMAA